MSGGSFFGSILGRSAPHASFDGARMSRLLKDWIGMGMFSADLEIRDALFELRSRSRDLVNNTSELGRFVSLVCQNVVGQHGIRLQARLKDATGTRRREVNRKLEAAFKVWGRRGVCTVDGKHSWLDVQKTVARTVPTDGDMLIRKVVGFDNPFGFALQLIDADHLDETFNRERDDVTGQNEIRMGVEVDVWKRPVAYHLKRNHPSERFDGNRERIDASEIVHPFVPHRLSATRGLPWAARVLFDIKMLKGYREAEVVAARSAAAKMGFFVDKDAQGSAPDPDEPVELRTSAAAGTLEKLPPGIEFQSWDPSHPTDAFDPFTKSLLRSIASGLDVAYASLSGDLSDVNFSSIRAGLIAERDVWRLLQQWMIQSTLDDIYRAWVPMARLSGHLDIRITTADYQNQIEWQPRGWTWVDPLKDVKAATEAINNGLDSRTRVVSERLGRDFEDVLDDLQREQEQLADRGLVLPGSAGESVADSEDPNDADGRKAAMLALVANGDG